MPPESVWRTSTGYCIPCKAHVRTNTGLIEYEGQLIGT